MIRPVGLTIALIPVFATRIITVRFSSARIVAIASNWYGKDVFPNHASLLRFTSI